MTKKHENDVTIRDKKTPIISNVTNRKILHSIGMTLSSIDSINSNSKIVEH